MEFHQQHTRLPGEPVLVPLLHHTHPTSQQCSRYPVHEHVHAGPYTGGGVGQTPLSAGIPLNTVRKLCRTPGSFTSCPAIFTWTGSQCATELR